MQSLAGFMEEAVCEQGGVVQGFTGDGVMAVFGAPVALEDAPLRACRAALAILERLKAAGGDLEAKHGVRPQLRIGINTGLAVVGQVQGGASAGVTVLGDTVNVAARLQATAEPEAVVMSEAMHRLVQGLVEASFAGEHQSKARPNLRRSIGSTPSARGRRGSGRRWGVASAPTSGENASWTFWSEVLRRRAANFTSSTSWPSRAWASRACSTSSGSA